MVLVFLIKFPIFFLHFWLPKMHVEASTTARMLLASLLLKFGVHGFSRFLIPLITYNLFILIFIRVLGMIVCLLLSLIEVDGKIIVAYSSVVHISFVLLS